MKDDGKGTAGILRAAAPYLSLGLQIAAAVVMFLLLGKYADERFGTKPWLMVAGIVAGFAGGMIKFFRDVMAMSEKEEDERRNAR